MRIRNYKVTQAANIICIMFEDYPVKTWYASDFSERKLQNAIRKLQKAAIENGMIARFERNF